jgi:hypothetical protein
VKVARDSERGCWPEVAARGRDPRRVGAGHCTCYRGYPSDDDDEDDEDDDDDESVRGDSPCASRGPPLRGGLAVQPRAKKKKKKKKMMMMMMMMRATPNEPSLAADMFYLVSCVEPAVLGLPPSASSVFRRIHMHSRIFIRIQNVSRISECIQNVFGMYSECLHDVFNVGSWYRSPSFSAAQFILNTFEYIGVHLNTSGYI